MNRREKVLKLIVEDFIKEATPVSSKSLIEKHGLEYSSATIRNEMNALENDGYLEKTHTSSGRVPSSKGYRYYVENLRERSLDEEFKYNVQAILDSRVQSVEEIIAKSCEILAHMTNLVSVVLGPNAADEHLVSVQLIPISDNSATCVFVTDRGYVENKTFVLDEKTRFEDVETCVKLLNERLKGTPIASLGEKMETIKPLLADYVIERDVIYNVMLEVLVNFAGERLKTYGTKGLFENPEFSNDATKIKKLIDLFNRPEVFREVSASDNNISLHIGGEDASDEDVSIVSARVSLPNDHEGNIAIVGPKRMDYGKVVSSLEYLIKILDRRFNHDDDSKGENEKDNGREKRKFES